MSSTAKYDAHAERWTDEAYADPASYLRRRAEVIVTLGPPLEPGDRVLDLACGDAGLADFLLPYGLGYVGVDLSEPMLEAARKRLAGRGDAVLADLNAYRPETPVAATTIFRAIYYAADRLAFFRHVASFTEKKLVFDLNPRQYGLDAVRADLAAAGFDGLAVRPFFAPQRHAPPRPVAALLRAAERSGPLARAALRFRFSYVCAAYRAATSSSPSAAAASRRSRS